jgi:hypothetical protein
MTHPRRPTPHPPARNGGEGGSRSDSLTRALERVAEAVGLEIRREPLDIGDARLPGGLCRLDGRPPVCILADHLGEEEEARAIGRALLAFDPDSVWMPPAARDFLDALRREAERR